MFPLSQPSTGKEKVPIEKISRDMADGMTDAKDAALTRTTGLVKGLEGPCVRHANCIRTHSPGSGCGAGPRRVRPFADSGEVTCAYAKLAEAEAPPLGPSSSAWWRPVGERQEYPSAGHGPRRRDFCACCRVCPHGVGAGADARIGRRRGDRRSWADPGRPGKPRDSGAKSPRRKSREPPLNESVGDPGITVCDRTDLARCRPGYRRSGFRRPGHRRPGVSPSVASRRSGAGHFHGGGGTSHPFGRPHD